MVTLNSDSLITVEEISMVPRQSTSNPHPRKAEASPGPLLAQWWSSQPKTLCHTLHKELFDGNLPPIIPQAEGGGVSYLRVGRDEASQSSGNSEDGSCGAWEVSLWPAFSRRLYTRHNNSAAMLWNPLYSKTATVSWKRAAHHHTLSWTPLSFVVVVVW